MSNEKNIIQPSVSLKIEYNEASLGNLIKNSLKETCMAY